VCFDTQWIYFLSLLIVGNGKRAMKGFARVRVGVVFSTLSGDDDVNGLWIDANLWLVLTRTAVVNPKE